uniref:BLUF domain-containing protein n=1 Tax=Monopterus albus TaxID=43700 RepID=A0A3Q3JZ27_MONAL|nr:uncharacterized protein C7orf62 homolog [Monopterus albus]XP_020460318.1 uncharacterized protein C7orf62 homolog [Monopterus albus]XP_020460319.1 uncharacterized protein C7orf62 homolog [Monopterus albus]XP_020460320.1 uncharacterized protein C7orf62 homolog [Monopterus albus]XP_020460321.1 uncharacterized protein C7orf62 homolog [Monopterus albus]XP_020460322.1 uncharacterized protein C7orf62 homolog [Monopterus albus]
MAASKKPRRVSIRPLENIGSEVEERYTMFDVIHGKMTEKIVLQRLIVIAQLPHDADRTELGAHYEKLNIELGKQYKWDAMTGLLLIYPSYLFHVIESSRDVLVSVLKDLKDMQQQRDCTLLGASKVVLMTHDPHSKMFQQWSYKVLEADLVAQGRGAKGLQEEGKSTETLVCTVLSALQRLSTHLELSKKALPGSVLDETPELIISQAILEELLARDELQSPQQYLQMYSSPLHITMDFGQAIRSSCLTTV